ncbi:methionyl-tRNA formyltransferase [Streptomyces gulbargensis]|uniref:Methionyl-tRNA formyltransferase n=2 Tax=Streptomyces TaxID=1883 RepID=A0ABP7M662_9ACTN
MCRPQRPRTDRQSPFMKLVFAGTPEVAVPALDALLASGRHEVAAVVTRPDAPAGRGRRLVASPVAQRAEEEGIEVLKPAKPRDEDFLARLREIAPDCCPVVAYGALLPRTALDIPAHGWVNLHFSLLPAWRGAAPVQHSLMAGDEVTGASTFRIEEGLDSGPVYGVVTEEIRPTDTSGDLLTRLAFAGAGLLAATMDGIEDGSLKPVPQPAEGVTLAPKIQVEDAHVDFAAPALRVDRVVRGCTPAPGAWTVFRGERLKLIQVAPLPDRTDLAPGELAAGKNNVYAGTGSYAVELLWVQPQGKKPMKAADWARGVRIAPGERLGA